MRNPDRFLRALGVVAASAVTLTAGSAAHASGFAVARFGGPHGNPTESNAASIYYNPAGLAMAPGTRLMLDVNWAWRSASYERDASALSPRPGGAAAPAVDIAANTGEGTLSNFIYSPMAGIATDFGTGLPFGIGFGFYAPFGGQAVWDSVDPVDGAPGAEDGPQRWYTIDGTIRTLALSLGGAYRIEPIRLSIGVSASYYISEIDTVRARTANGQDFVEQEGRSYISTEASDIGIGVGLMAEPIVDTLWVGASWQSAPGFDGKQVLEGTLQNVFTGGEPESDEVTMTSQLPDIFRLGVRYRPLADLELRLFGDYTRWSVMDNQCVVSNGQLGNADIYEFCDGITENGSFPAELGQVTLNAARDWHDAGGVRLGGSYWLAGDRVELMLDLGYDSNAIPDDTLEPALFDMGKVSAGLGATIGITSFMRLNLTGTDIIYFERDTTGNPTATSYVPPTRQPSSAGVYNQNIFVLNTGLTFDFNGQVLRRNREAAAAVVAE